MNTNSPTSSSTHLRDYQPSSHLIPTIDLTFNLSPELTIVTNRMKVISQGSGNEEALRLDADNLTFISVSVDGRELAETEYDLTAKNLILHSLPPTCTLEIKNSISPANNKELMGLYASSGNMCTQCEAQVIQTTSRHGRQHYHPSALQP